MCSKRGNEGGKYATWPGYQVAACKDKPGGKRRDAVRKPAIDKVAQAKHRGTDDDADKGAAAEAIGNFHRNHLTDQCFEDRHPEDGDEKQKARRERPESRAGRCPPNPHEEAPRKEKAASARTLPN